MGILRTHFARGLVLLGFGTLCIVIDGAFFDLFPSIVFYLVLEYLWFESSFDPIRVMAVLMFHSIACFANLSVGHIVLFILYALSLLWREYFLKPFFPFAIYSLSLCVTFVFIGSNWIGSVLVSLLSLSLWRVKLEEV
ncbi:MAG: Uncharacterized protein XD58_0341 [Thermotoga sp. 50_1627]|uniref:hypothetical protein n=1 Tax=Pseudothermotoga sp. TaxID=2033661 RepID=UPI00076BC774|nr:MAG: Uncharacterized protein XD45_0353 [Thermotoga sp. 50_64]KUK25678.1 MAG: Uncharacterized protein XD58_0341 [Thermotoga sp. 50_1627]MBC7115591.1 hypothetical protein [Pseudothermotoga sp.]MDK2923607.1 hypothetical protein [Pseudothermotoga sp.]HBT39991.1 hypothetical protein [Pseudothermotoga sp.]